jgi:DHA1 family bicyclomycin/chloramphenicol resistance-like MFS transporter
VSPAALVEAFSAVARSRQTVAFGLVVTCLFGIMTSFIGSFEIIVTEVFDRKALFPVIFGVLACTLGAGALLNARLVLRTGLYRMVRLTATYVVAAAAVMAMVAAATDGTPPLWLFCLLLAGLLPGMALLLPNSNTAAMAPVPHVAGMASAILGTLSTAGGALLGARVDGAFDGTIRPFAYAALLYALLAGAVIVLLARTPTTEG